MEPLRQSVPRASLIRPPRKILCIAAFAACLAAGDVPPLSGPYGYIRSGTSAWAAVVHFARAPALLRAGLSQTGRKLIFMAERYFCP